MIEKLNKLCECGRRWKVHISKDIQGRGTILVEHEVSDPILFSDRRKLAKEFNGWADKNKVKKIPEAVIAFMQRKNYFTRLRSEAIKLNEDDQFLSTHIPIIVDDNMPPTGMLMVDKDIGEKIKKGFLKIVPVMQGDELLYCTLVMNTDD